MLTVSLYNLTSNTVSCLLHVVCTVVAFKWSFSQHLKKLVEILQLLYS